MRTLCSFRMLMQAQRLCGEVGGESCKAILTLISGLLLNTDCAGIAGKRTMIEPAIMYPCN